MPFDAEAAEREFHLYYGGALAAWTQLEGHLSHLFESVTEMHPLMASHIFFSARSFQGRIEMLHAAIRIAGYIQKGRSEGVNTLHAIARKAETWSKSRNSLAHDVPRLDLKPGSISAGQYVITSGKATWSHPDMAQGYFDNRITLEHMKIMRENFKKLSGMISPFLTELSWPPPEQLRTLREQVLQLPQFPYSNEPTPKRSERQKRPLP